MTLDIGDWRTPYLDVTPYDGTTVVTLAITTPAGVTTTPAVVASATPGRWESAAYRLTAAGEWVERWTVTGTGAGAERVRLQVVASTGPDMLADPADLLRLVGVTADATTTAKAALLVEVATAIVQSEAGHQRLVLVAGEEITLTGTTDSWLTLPQLPVVSVAAVELDGVVLTAGAAGSGGTTYRLRGQRLWRGDGWQTYVGEPSEVTVTYTHGYAAGAQQLQLARSAVIGLIRGAYGNPEGLTSLRIDDYAAAYDAMSARMEASPHLRTALGRQYGHRSGPVRL